MGLNMTVYQQSAAAVLWDVDEAPSFALIDKKESSCRPERLIAPSSNNTGSPEVLQTAADWHQFCRLNHSKCSSLPTRKPGWIPSRLVDLGQAQDESWSLIITDDQAGRLIDAQYATLSYRWGSKPQALMLKTSTLGDFLGGKPIADLPQTFKDFIVVARKLGFKYVWIDCLCIMQDCSQDWNHEASTMRDVYANSGCNVVACASSDPEGGLFRYRHPSNVSPGLVEIRLSSGQAQTFVIWDDEFDDRNNNVTTLADRGWVFQERFLAPRLLSFHGQRISWECCEGRQREGEFQIFEDSISIMDELLASVQQNAKASYGEMTEATLKLWEKLVGLYSQCKLTKSEDKLVAFAGVAKAFQELTGDTYLAGVWRSQLLAQLSWTALEETRAVQFPKKYRAPSWSWASIDSPVWPRFYGKRPGWKNQKALEIIDAGATSNAFEGMADVSHAWLKVRGTCFGCSYEKQADEWFPLRSDADPRVELETKVIVDATEYEFADEGRTILLLYKVISHYSGRLIADAIILLPVSGSGNVYRRIGWAHIRPCGGKSPLNLFLYHRIKEAELVIV
ncbi:heterokaryon incompatibility protein [Colletotrichum asianum]